MCHPYFGFVIVILACLASMGCETDGTWTVNKILGWDDPKAPKTPKYPQPNTEIAMRVENMGHRIIAQNEFIGIDPLFTTIGVPESVLFHKGTDQMFISEGLVKLCKSDDELAAVICSELGQMIAEKRAVRRAGAERDSFPESSLPGGSPVMTGGGTPDDVGRMAEIAYQERRQKAASVADPVDAAKQSRTLLSTAGFDPALLDQVQPLLKQSDRSAILRKQMSASAPPPKWDNPNP
jgi:predicted Zn-dependent protease